MTDSRDMSEVGPLEMAGIIARLEPRTPFEGDFDLAPDISADTKAGLRPRSVKMSDELDLRCQVRASDLGLSKSAYIRRLIEDDTRAAYSGEPEMVPLAEVQVMVSKAVAEVIAQLAHRYGHAA